MYRLELINKPSHFQEYNILELEFSYQEQVYKNVNPLVISNLKQRGYISWANSVEHVVIVGDYSLQPAAGRDPQIPGECDQGGKGNDCHVQGSRGSVHQHVSGQSASLVGQQVLSLPQATGQLHQRFPSEVHKTP